MLGRRRADAPAPVLEPGSKVWIPHATKVYCCVEVLSQNTRENSLTVVYVNRADDESGSEGKEAVIVPLNDVVARVDDNWLTTIADLVDLTELSEPAILHHLRQRYSSDLIYTSVGPILISLNPYKQLSQYYGEEQLRLFTQKKQRSDEPAPPHIYGVAATAYNNLLMDGKDQSVLISGESGAGKTEATKLILRYLAYASELFPKTRQRAQSVSPNPTHAVGTIEKRLLQASPVLEAFGNAKTARNNNSSRFGKFVKIFFDSNGRMQGAEIINYLLEKSRICALNDTERNYHVFYQMCAGLDDEHKKKFGIVSAEEFRYLNQGRSILIDGVDDAAEYRYLRAALSDLGINDDEQNAIFQILAAILHLGNLKFVKAEKPKSSNITLGSGLTLSPGASKSLGVGSHGGVGEGCAVSNREVLILIAQLLGSTVDDLEGVLCNRSMGSAARKSVYTIPLTPEDARQSCDTLSKVLYESIFDWLVSRINKILAPAETGAPRRLKFIGVLDIFGFEIFESNSFEQLCINYANEKLQQLFNVHIFQQEQDEYQNEGIHWLKIDFNNNQECVDLLEKKPSGVLALLTEECRFPKGTDNSFLTKINSAHAQRKFFLKPRPEKAAQHFKIGHYAEPVEYCVDGMTAKNKDQMSLDLVVLLQNSSLSFLSSLFAHHNTGKAAAKQRPTLSEVFKTQLDSLVTTLNATGLHFVRCIKPNKSKAPALFEPVDVVRQLRCAGVIECVRIRRDGYPIRFPFQQFYRRYKLLLKDKVNAITTQEADLGPDNVSGALSLYSLGCQALVEFIHKQAHICFDGVQMGKSKVFLGSTEYVQINALREVELHQIAVIIQTRWRSFLPRRQFKRKVRAATSVQAAWRRCMYRKRYKQMLAEKQKEQDQSNKQGIVEDIAVARKKQSQYVARKEEEEEQKRREDEDRRRQKLEEDQRKANELLENGTLHTNKEDASDARPKPGFSIRQTLRKMNALKRTPSCTNLEAYVPQPIAHPPEPWFIPKSTGLPPDEEFKNRSGFTLYLDGARFLPAKCTATVVLAQLYRGSGKKMGPEMKAFANVCSSAYHPIFRFHQTIRMRVCDPTLTLVIKVLTLEKGSRQQKVVGYALLNIFALSKSRSQPTDSAMCYPEVVLNQGAFQLPLKGTTPPSGNGVRRDMLDDATALPCASLLVRLAPASPSGAPSLPQYDTGVYDTTWCKFGKEDEAKAKARLQAPNVAVRDLFGDICDSGRVVAEARKGGGPATDAWMDAVFSNRAEGSARPLRAFLDSNA